MIFGAMSVYDFLKGSDLDVDTYISKITKKYINARNSKMMSCFALTFALNFFLEWGDRSQVVTAAMIVT